MVAYSYPVEDHKNRTSNFDIHMNKLNQEGLEFPMKVKDIPEFKKTNTRGCCMF